jgi:hypothetical protein
LASPPASGDVIAAVDVPVGTDIRGCPQHTDIALIDAATGARTPLPSGVNTAADELHPNINPFGTRMTFARVDHAAGTTQIVFVNLSTGQQAQLFNFFDASTMQPTDPVLTPDGNSVMTGAPFAQPSNGHFVPVETLTSLANFPGGPFPHSTRTENTSFANSGQTFDPIQRSDGLLAAFVISGTARLLLDLGGGVVKLEPDGGHPAFSDPTTNVVVFQHLDTDNGSFNAHLAFRPVGTFATAASVDLPPGINAKESDELNAAFTPDGRYLGFVRYAHGGDRHMRLFVFDVQTQTLLNSSGIDLGSYASFECEQPVLPPSPPWPIRGGISLRETVQLVTSSITFTGSSGLISFLLSGSSSVGILVQRIVGHHKLFGHIVPTLKIVGRVPLGKFMRGRHKVHWNLRVNGRRLRKGTYLVTPRLVSRSGVVHELGKPRKLRIR